MYHLWLAECPGLSTWSCVGLLIRLSRKTTHCSAYYPLEIFVTKNTHKILLGEQYHLHVIVAQNVSCEKVGGNLPLICPRHSRSSEMSNNFIQQKAVQLSGSVQLMNVKFFSCVSLAKATGTRMNNFYFFLSNVPHLYHP